MTVTRPLTASEKAIIQQEVDQIYADFKGRVAEGRKLAPAVVDSIAQGRVWTGEDALQIKLVDGIGGLDRAVRSAAAMASLKEYSLRTYPEPKSPIDYFFSSFGRQYREQVMREEMGEEAFQSYKKARYIREQAGVTQARWPYDLTIH
jgi:protease IV